MVLVLSGLVPGFSFDLAFGFVLSLILGLGIDIGFGFGLLLSLGIGLVSVLDLVLFLR